MTTDSTIDKIISENIKHEEKEMKLPPMIAITLDDVLLFIGVDGDILDKYQINDNTVTISARYYGSSTFQGYHSHVYNKSLGWITRLVKIWICEEIMDLRPGSYYKYIPNAKCIYQIKMKFNNDGKEFIEDAYGLRYILREIYKNDNEIELASVRIPFDIISKL
jgi:hypothetical protein